MSMLTRISTASFAVLSNDSDLKMASSKLPLRCETSDPATGLYVNLKHGIMYCW